MKIRFLVVAALVAAAFTNVAYARYERDDPTCTTSCSAAAKANGSCKDYRRDDGTCFQVISSSGSSSSASSSSVSSDGVYRTTLRDVGSSSTVARFRCTAYSNAGNGRAASKTVHLRVGTAGGSTNFRDYGRSRTTNSQGDASISGPRASGDTCFKCVVGASGQGTHSSSVVCLN